MNGRNEKNRWSMEDIRRIEGLCMEDMRRIDGLIEIEKRKKIKLLKLERKVMNGGIEVLAGES